MIPALRSSWLPLMASAILPVSLLRAEAPWKFVVIPDAMNNDVAVDDPDWYGDGLDGTFDDGTYAAWPFTLNAIAAESPDFVLVPGDLVQGRWSLDAFSDAQIASLISSDPANFGHLAGLSGTEARKEHVRWMADRFYPDWNQMWADYGIPTVLTIPGDHELGDNDWNKSYDPDVVPIYRQKYEQYRPAPTGGVSYGPFNGRTFSLTHKNLTLVGVDVFDQNEGGNVSIGVGAPHLNFIQQELANATTAHKVAMAHTPILPGSLKRSSSGLELPGGATSNLWQTFVTGDVDMFLAGEVHDISMQQQDFLLQMVCGSQPSNVTEFNYLVVTVHDDRLELELKLLETTLDGPRDFSKDPYLVDPYLERQVKLTQAQFDTGFFSVGTMVIDKSGGNRIFTNKTGDFASSRYTNLDPDPDTTPPASAAFTPSNGSGNVAIGADLSVTFDEAVSFGTGFITLRESSGGTEVERFDVASPSSGLSLSGATVTLNPASDLALSTGYYVEIDASAIEDLSGNSFPGIVGSADWSFTTAASDPPAQVGPIFYYDFENDTNSVGGVNDGSGFGRDGTSPSGNFVGDSPTGITGSTSLQMNGLAGSGFGIDTPGFNGIGGAASRTFAGWVKTSASKDQNIFEYGEESFGKRFTLRLDEATPDDYVLRFEINGSALLGTSVINDGTWHHVAVVIDSNAANNVQLFVDGSAESSGALSLASSTKNNARIGERIGNSADPRIFDGNLDDLALWTAALSASDIAALASGTATPLTLTQAPDPTPPSLQSTEPANETSGVAVGSPLVATFSEAIALKDGGTITIRNLGPSGGPDEVITIPDATRLVVAGEQLTIFPADALETGNQYAVQISSNAIRDFAANPNFFPGINDDATWSFITEAEASPTPIVHFEFDGDLTDSAGSRDGSLLNSETTLGTTGARLGSGYLAIDPTGDANLQNVGFISGGDPIDLGTGARTIAFFVRAAADQSPSTRPTFFSIGSGTGIDTGQRFDLCFPGEFDTDDLRVEVNGNGAGGGDIDPIPTDLGDGNWHHVAITSAASGTLGALEIFVDGVSIGTVGAGSDPLIDTASSAIVIGDSFGGSPTNPFRGLDGDIDDFRIYDEALTPSDILSLANAASGTFADWIAGKPGVGAQTGLDDDPDGDGVENGVENFFGTEPGEFSQGLIAESASAGSFTFSHPQGTLAGDLTAVYRWSTDLVNFHDDGQSAGGTTVDFSPATAAGTTTVTATVSGTAIDRLFVIVGVTQN